MKYLSPFVSILVVLAVHSADAVTRRVPSQYPTIQAGVDAAVSGDTVLVAAGTYSGPLHVGPGGGADTTRCVVHLKSGVSLIGAGAGRSIINPDSLGRGIQLYAVTNARIEGFTIRRAFAAVYGAGIYCTTGSSPSIRNCTISQCYDGAIIAISNSSPTITNCLLRDNLSKQGGGIAAEINSSPIVTNCSIIHNAAPIAGGVFVRDGGVAVFTACTIDSNYLDTVNGAGGGVAVRNAEITLRRCTVNRNVSSGQGGGIDLRDLAIAIVESTYVQQNRTTANYGPGGGIYCEISDMNMDYCAITGNSAPGASADGGGIYFFFTGQTALGGTTITNCTIAANAAPATPDSLGAGITCYFAAPLIEKSIIAFNTPGKGIRCLEEGAPVVSCSDIYGNQDGDVICGTSGTGNFSQNPLFCDAANRVYVLGATSPCLPGHHPSGAPCGLIGAFSTGTCTAGVEEVPDGDAAVAGIHFASPNPSRGPVLIHFMLTEPGTASVGIFDTAGRLVRQLSSRWSEAGAHQLTWDGRTASGGRAPQGVYFYRIVSGGAASTGRIVVAR